MSVSWPQFLGKQFSVKPSNPRLFPAPFSRRAEMSVTSAPPRSNPNRVVLESDRILKAQQQQQCNSFPTLIAISTARKMDFRPSPELGFFSLLFVISMALGAFLSLAIISLPTMKALKGLAVSMDKLSKVVSEEVPGTLSSLKLSGLEINDLTSQLNSLRQRISGKQYGKRERMSKPRSNGERNDSIIN